MEQPLVETTKSHESSFWVRFLSQYGCGRFESSLFPIYKLPTFVCLLLPGVFQMREETGKRNQANIIWLWVKTNGTILG